MNEHLPECMIADFENGRWICICNALRACEQRCDEKRHAEVRAWSELSRDNFDHGFAAGIDAAEAAVVYLRDERRQGGLDFAIDAIRALKEKS